MNCKQRLDNIFGSFGYEFYLETNTSSDVSKNIFLARKLLSDCKFKEAIDALLSAIEEANRIFPDILMELYVLFISVGQISNGYYCLLNAKEHISLYYKEDSEHIIKYCEIFESILSSLDIIQSEQNRFEKESKKDLYGSNLGFLVTKESKKAVVQKLTEEICGGKVYKALDDESIERELKICNDLRKEFTYKTN